MIRDLPTSLRTWLILLALTVTTWTASPAESQDTYRVVDVGTLLSSGAHFSYVHSVNNNAQIVGFSYVLTGYRAFLLEPSTGFLLNLGDLIGGDDHSVARAVNDAGTVVGSSSATIMVGGIPTTVTRAFMWKNGVGISDLGAEISTEGGSFAYAINTAGQVVGSRTPQGVSTYIRGAFLWSDGAGVTFLPHLQPTNLPNSEGFALNDAAVVVGESSNQTTADFAYSWDDQLGISTLPTDPGLTSAATDINDLGTITGRTITSDGTGGYVANAFLWQQGPLMTLIDNLPGMLSGYGYAVNNSNQVVGKSIIDPGTVCITRGSVPAPICFSDEVTDRAILWTQATSTLQLDTLIDPADPLSGLITLTSARDISDHGFIAANGYLSGQSGQHGFLLIPNTIFVDGFESGGVAAWSLSVP